MLTHHPPPSPTRRYGNTVDYFSGLTAVTCSPDGDSVYAVGTSAMPGIGGAWCFFWGEGSWLSMYRI